MIDITQFDKTIEKIFTEFSTRKPSTLKQHHIVLSNTTTLVVFFSTTILSWKLKNFNSLENFELLLRDS